MSREFVVDGIFYQIGKSGIARVWNKLLEQWVQTGFADKVVVLDRARTAPRVQGVAYHDVPAFFFEREAEDRQMLQAVCDSYGAQAFISTYYTVPLTTPSLMMVHDMIPEVLGWDLTQPMWRQKQQAMAYASAFVTVSTNTAEDLKRFLKRPDLPVSVALNGCDFAPATAQEVADFRQRLGLDKPYFLLSGSRNDYKNAILFFKAFEKLGADRGRYIVLCSGGGALEPEMLACVGNAEVRVGVLSDDDMRCAYSGALALVYPSLYEGFGLPVLEAMACACPVISAEVASLPEVGGDAPLYVQLGASAVDQLADHLITVQEDAVRSSMIEKGLRQAAHFKWDKMASRVQDLLSSTARISHGSTQGLVREHTCRLCGARTRPLFRKQVLHRFDVQYEQCENCEAVQTEQPYWLEHAYVPENEMFDTGQVTRSLINAAVVKTILDICGLGPDTRLVDYGCGSGLFVRTLRDMGVDAWGYDVYCQPRLALGFQTPSFKHFDVINMCEVVEHFDKPREYFDDIFETDPQLLIFQTGIANQVSADWDYLAPEHGQHIFFLSPKTIHWLCQTYQRVHLSVLGFQVLATPEMAGRLLDPTTGAIKSEHQGAINEALSTLWRGLFSRPYYHAGLDNQRLRKMPQPQ